jgi:hypothetical protein
VDLRIVPRRSCGAALHYFTGSKAHNVAVRKLGVEHGLRINEYGVFRIPKGKKAEELGKEESKRIGGATEEEVFRAVDIAWVPPELREGRGEMLRSTARGAVALARLAEASTGARGSSFPTPRGRQHAWAPPLAGGTLGAADRLGALAAGAMGKALPPGWSRQKAVCIASPRRAGRWSMVLVYRALSRYSLYTIHTMAIASREAAAPRWL